MSRLLLAAAASLVAAPALAGGFTPVVVTPPPVAPVAPIVPVAPSADWTGGYVGGQFGYGSFATEIESEGESFEFLQGDGALYGLHAGYMFDFGRLVAGGEIDFDGTRMGIGAGDDFDVPDPDLEVGDVGSIVRLKGRLGFDAGRLLPYVTAGVARLTFDFDADEGDEAGFDDSGEGHFIGLGASYMLSDRFMVGLEALRHDFDTPLADDFEAEDVEITTDVNTVTLRGSFRF